MRTVGAVLAGAVLSLAVSEASATPISGANSGIAAPAKVLTFDTPDMEFLGGVVIGSQYAVSHGVTFASSIGGIIYNPTAGAGPTQVGNVVGNFRLEDLYTSSITMNFATAQTGVAFAMISDSAELMAPWSFSAYLGASLIESFNALVDLGELQTDQWYGFDGISFDRIVLNTPGGSLALFDNIQMSSYTPPPPPGVPAPASLALVGLGMVGFAGLRRRAI